MIIATKILTFVLMITVIYMLIALTWQFAEKRIYGVVTPRGLDDVVAVILALSIYFNIK